MGAGSSFSADLLDGGGRMSLEQIMLSDGGLIERVSKSAVEKGVFANWMGITGHPPLTH